MYTKHSNCGHEAEQFGVLGKLVQSYWPRHTFTDGNSTQECENNPFRESRLEDILCST